MQGYVNCVEEEGTYIHTSRGLEVSESGRVCGSLHMGYQDAFAAGLLCDYMDAGAYI